MKKSFENELVLRSSELFIDRDTEDSGCLFNTPDAEVVVYVKTSPSKTSNNEDSAGVFSLSPTGIVIAVADGMGGMPCGAEASRKAIESFNILIKDDRDNEPGFREPILNAIENANDAILGLNVGAGSTIAVAAISENVLRSYHAGDSEVLVVGQRGKIKLQTIPHTPAGYAQEAGIIDDEAAFEHDERHLLTNYLGSTDMRIEIGPAVKLARYDTVLIASDGVFDNLFRDELINIIRKGELVAIAESLVAKIANRMNGGDSNFQGKADDVSFILYRRKR